MKKINSIIRIAIFLMMCYILSTVVYAAGSNLSNATENDDNITEYNGDRLESDGYDSPEMAVATYIEGFAENNINKMLSAYAIETYVDHLRLVNQVERLQSYTPYIKEIPVISEYSRQINIEMRRSSIIDSIRQQYLMLTESKTVGEYASMSVLLSGYSSGQELIEDIFATDDTDILQNIEFSGEFMQPEVVCDGRYRSENNQKNLQIQSECMGVDEIRSVAALFSVNSKPYLLIMDTAYYGDRWYILHSQGNLGSIIGLSSLTGGIVPIFSDEYENIDFEAIQSALYRIE